MCLNLENKKQHNLIFNTSFIPLFPTWQKITVFSIVTLRLNSSLTDNEHPVLHPQKQRALGQSWLKLPLNNKTNFLGNNNWKDLDWLDTQGHTKQNLPEVSFQFFLLKQSRDNWPHEDFIGEGSNHEVTEDTHRTNPTGAAKTQNTKIVFGLQKKKRKRNIFYILSSQVKFIYLYSTFKTTTVDQTGRIAIHNVSIWCGRVSCSMG